MKLKLRIQRWYNIEKQIWQSEWYLLKGDIIRWIRSKQDKPSLDVWVRYNGK